MRTWYWILTNLLEICHVNFPQGLVKQWHFQSIPSCQNTSTRHPVCNHLIKLHELDHLKCHQWTRLGNQQIYSIIIQADLSCGGTIHLTSIDVILLSSPKVHTYTWILLQLFDSYYPDKWTHESNELVIIIKRHWSTREHTWFTYTFWIWTSSRSLILLIEEQAKMIHTLYQLCPICLGLCSFMLRHQ